MAGGRNPIVGLLYELAITLHNVLAIEGVRVPDEGDNFGFDLSGSALGSDKEVLLQYCDTDLTVVDGDEIVITQCKATEADSQIGESDLRQVIVDAAKQLSRIRETNSERTLGAFVLATNRRLRPDMEELRRSKSIFGNSGTSATAEVPSYLGPTASTKTVDAWCRALKDGSRRKRGEEAPVLSIEDAACAAEILLKFHFAPINRAKCEQVFERAMVKFGLKPDEITGLAHSIGGALLDGIERSVDDVRGVLADKIMSRGDLRSLCPDAIEPLRSSILHIAWEGSDLPLGEPSQWRGDLPRRESVDSIAEKIQRLEDEYERGALALLGDGGSGKTWLLFEAMNRLRTAENSSDVTRTFLLGNHRRPEFILHDALSPFFEDYRAVSAETGNGLLKRTVDAFEACGAATNIWIVLPNSDELHRDLLRSLLDSFENSPKGVRFLFTARKGNWPRNHRLFRTGRYLSEDVGMLDRSEQYAWFTREEPVLENGAVDELLVPANANYIPQRQHQDAVRRGYIDHPLAFRALKEWLGGVQAVERARVAEGFLDAEWGAVRSFMGFFRESLCERVGKHSPVDIEEVYPVFDRMSNERSELPSTPLRNAPERFCGRIARTEAAEALMEQFVQVGVVRQRDDEQGTLEWAVPYVDMSGGRI